MDRRHFLRAGVYTAGGTAGLPIIARAAAGEAGTSPYGSLDGIAPDANGVILPAGFTSRIVAVAGEKVGSTDYEWPIFPDGAAVFDDGEGGWIHTVNSEVFVAGAGGVSAIHYDSDGEIVDAYRILDGSIANCGGGPTPWGTFLSGEEDFAGGLGVLWECDPTGATEAKALTAMGRFPHEAAAVDPVREHVYETEDMPDGRLYRFTPTSYPRPDRGAARGGRRRRRRRGVVDRGARPLGGRDADPPAGARVDGVRRRGGHLVPRRLDLLLDQVRQQDPAIDLENLTHEVIYAADLPPSRQARPCCPASTTSPSTVGPATSSWPRTAATWRS
ncbi:MAG: DUF839 domain-containing protein [Acidimicrobiales bacterium]